MKNAKNFTLLLFCFGLFFFIGCTKTHTYEVVFYPETNKFQGYHKVVVKNPQKGDYLNDSMENALKTQLTDLNSVSVPPSKDRETLKATIAVYNYQPKLELEQKGIAFLQYEVSAKEKLQRTKRVDNVALNRCNYLLKKNKCRVVKRTKITNGMQKVSMTVKGKFQLVDINGKEILPAKPFDQTFSESGKIVPSSLFLLTKGLNSLAYDFTKQILPHRKKVTVELDGGGDDLAKSLILAKAYRNAVTRLNSVISKEEDLADVYHMGIALEALNEMISATNYYRRGARMDPDDENIQKALKRVTKIRR